MHTIIVLTIDSTSAPETSFRKQNLLLYKATGVYTSWQAQRL